MIRLPNNAGEPYEPVVCEPMDPYDTRAFLNEAIAHVAEWINLNYPPKEAS